MNRLFDKIFNPKGHISKEKTKAYFKDELTDKERNEVEQILEDSDFEKEAFEGFEMSPKSIRLLGQLNPNFKENNSNSTKTILYTFSGIAAALAIVIGILWLNTPSELENTSVAENAIPKKNDTPKKEEKTISSEQKLENQTKKTETDEQVNTSKESIQGKENANLIEKKEVPLPSPSTTDDAKIENEEETIETELLDAKAPASVNVESDLAFEMPVENEIESNEIPSKEKSIHHEEENKNISNQDLAGNTTSTLDIAKVALSEEKSYLLNSIADKGSFDYNRPNYVLGYKTINNDYRFSNNKKTRFKKNELIEGRKVKSTSPEFSDASDIDNAKFSRERNEQQYKSYDEVLLLGLTRLKDKEYNLALSYFNDILKSFPSDLNAKYLWSGSFNRAKERQTSHQVVKRCSRS